MTLYFVENQHGHIVSGPFRNIEHARKAADDYDGTPLFGNCHLKAIERDDDKNRKMFSDK